MFGLPAHPWWAHLTVVAIPVAAVLAGVVAVFPRAPRLVKVTTLLLGGCRWRWATPGVSTPGPSEQEER